MQKPKFRNIRNNLFEFYNTISGDVDEKAYNSDILVQRYFQRRKTEVIKNLLQVRKQDILLDIGCGSGVQIKEVGASGYALAIGVDINWNAIRFARGKSLPNTEFIVADAQHLPIKPASVDKVICAEIIEHLIFPQNLIIEISNVLKKDGEVVITTPNNNLLWKIYEYLWDKFGRGRNYGETHISLFRENKLKHQFMGFSECKTITIFFIAPLLAVSNSNLLLELGKKADRVFERFGWGVSIILHARK